MSTPLFTATWYPWYVDAVLESERVDAMTLEEEGAYRRAIDKAWKKGSLPADAEICARVIGKNCPTEVAQTVLNMLVPSPTQPGRMISERLEEIRKEQEAKYKTRSKGGRAAAEKRAKNAQENSAELTPDLRSTDAQVTPSSRTTDAPLSDAAAKRREEKREEEKEEKKERKIPNSPPGIEIIREIAGRYPRKKIWEALIAVVGENPDRIKLQQCFVAWNLKGFNPENFSWVTDWYVNGVPPNARVATAPAEYRHPQTGLPLGQYGR
jgi:hypothetical protein